MTGRDGGFQQSTAGGSLGTGQSQRRMMGASRELQPPPAAPRAATAPGRSPRGAAVTSHAYSNAPSARMESAPGGEEGNGQGCLQQAPSGTEGTPLVNHQVLIKIFIEDQHQHLYISQRPHRGQSTPWLCVPAALRSARDVCQGLFTSLGW